MSIAEARTVAATDRSLPALEPPPEKPREITRLAMPDLRPPRLMARKSVVSKRPALSVPTFPKPIPAPREEEAPAGPPIHPEDVDLGHYSIYLLEGDLELVLAKLNGAIAFGPHGKRALYHRIFQAPDWREVELAEPVSSREFASYTDTTVATACSAAVSQGLQLVRLVRAEKRIPGDQIGYLALPKTANLLIAREVQRHAAERGVKKPGCVKVRFDAASNTGFSVVSMSAAPG
jgi:hypothetical protein